MKLPENIHVFGDLAYRNKKCPPEAAEQVAFIQFIRLKYPNSYGKVITHIRNEGKTTVQQRMRHKNDGMIKGASDIIIPASITFVCELKRRDHTLSKISEEQIAYLESAQKLGAFACVGLGYDGAIEAFSKWRIKMLNAK